MDLVAGFIRGAGRYGAVQLQVRHHACREEIPGSALIEEPARHGHRSSPGNLYPVLVDSRNRRRYSATEQGRLAFQEGQAALRGLTGEMLP